MRQYLLLELLLCTWKLWWGKCCGLSFPFKQQNFTLVCSDPLGNPWT